MTKLQWPKVGIPSLDHQSFVHWANADSPLACPCWIIKVGLPPMALHWQAYNDLMLACHCWTIKVLSIGPMLDQCWHDYVGMPTTAQHWHAIVGPSEFCPLGQCWIDIGMPMF